MDTKIKTDRLRKYLEKVAPGIYDKRSSGLEGLPANDKEMSQLEGSLERLASKQELNTTESLGLEAIVHKKFRPAVFISDNTFTDLPEPWTHYGQSDIKQNIENAIPSIGRIELPSHLGIPFGGTGFVVGQGLIMTNRHVAEIFARGLGVHDLQFKTGLSAGVNFRKEKDLDDLDDLKVTRVEMIHPYWDMALLRVEGLSDSRKPLTLSTKNTEDLIGSDIAVVGYPALDRRNDIELQNDIFQNVYNVKRLQPGKIESARGILSFGNDVRAATHDASTLGGNSGSAVIDVQSGEIIALHFAGLYLDANFAVPTYELARDNKVTDSGAIFGGSIKSNADWVYRWAIADNITNKVETSGGNQQPPAGGGSGGDTNWHGASGSEISITLPLKITVSIGEQTSPSKVQLNDDQQNASEGIFGTPKIDDEEITQRAYHLSSALFLEQSEYKTITALTAAAASKLVYSDRELVESTCQSKFNFQSCQFLKNNNTECFVAFTGSTALVCFRGTQGVEDWISNLHLAEQATEFGMVHGGFLQGYLDINQQIERALSTSLAGKQIVLAGHSLGGALATIAASEWRDKYDIRSIYTFGQPAVGDRKFRRSMDIFTDRFFRVVNDDDIVTRIPPPYKHVGTKIKLPPTSHLETMEPISPTSFSGTTDEIISEADFYQLQNRLSPNKSSGLEGILPSIKDHSITQYLDKLMKQVIAT